MRFGLVIPAAVLSLLLICSTASALGPPPGAQANASKKVTCKGTKVPVTTGKRTTCKPLAKAIPKPKAIDIRRAHLEEALNFDPAKAVRGKKRKRARTLQSGFGAAGKRAQKKVLKLLPKALAFVDRKGGGAHSSRLVSGPANASGTCQPGPAGPTGNLGGATVGLLGDNGAYIDAPVGGGLRVRVSFASCGGVTNFHLPECPTANGSVDGKGSGEFRATIEVWDGGRLASRNSSVFEDKAKVHGEVGPDAKLKFIEVEHTEEVFIVASGGIVIRGGVTRKVRIEMPGGRYDPANASVRFFGDSISRDSGAGSFASTAEAAIRTYKAAEPRWSTFKPPYCAEPSFAPDSNTLKLKKGDKKQLAIYAKAKDGGRATAAKWTLLNPLNADFSPTSSEDPAPNISYTVTNSPKGGQVKVTVKFTSTAGVGEKTWTQPTEEESTGHLVGNFSGEVSTPTLNGPSVQSWSGTAKLKRSTPDILGGPNGSYEIESAGISFHLSGQEGLAVTDCDWSGNQLVEVPAGKMWGGAGVFGALPELAAPYTYSIQVSIPAGSKIKFKRSNCGESAKKAGYEGTEEEITFGGGLDTGEQVSSDGIVFSGSSEESLGVTYKQSWNFKAEP